MEFRKGDVSFQFKFFGDAVFVVFGSLLCRGLGKQGGGCKNRSFVLWLWDCFTLAHMSALPFAMTEGDGFSGVGVVTARKFNGRN
jgi:hypothetical protein